MGRKKVGMWMLAALGTAGLLGGTATAGAATVNVTPSAMGNWSLFTTNNTDFGTPGTGSPTDIATIVAGPPATGVQLATGSNHGDESAQLRDSTDWVGTSLASLQTLSYSTYCTASNATPPTVSQDTFFILYVNNSLAPGGVDRLFFEPIYSDGGDVTNPSGDEATPALNTWQNWNLLGGMWYSDAFGGSGSNALTWSQILTDEGANATIADDTADSLGGIRFTVGETSPSDNLNVYVNDFTIGTATNTVTYNFEPATAVPLPAAANMGLAALAAIGAAGLLRKKLRTH